MAQKTNETIESHEFKAEIQQLLDILIHSIYTSKDIFIRELVSNASDALEKMRFLQLQGGEIHDKDRELEIRIDTKKADDGCILTITDTGIGMTADEARDNIGTIARSGATAFLERLKNDPGDKGEKKDVSLIGQFGVGFYAVFMAAKKVVLTSRSADPNAAPVVWSSDGIGTYTIAASQEEMPRGTKIEVHLKEDDARFAEAETVKAAIRKYSSFVPFPVRVDGEQVNSMTALWREQPLQVKEEQYNEFFKYLTHDPEEPRLRLHLSVDAPLQYSALLFVPSTNPEVSGFGREDVRLQLYVKRVLIDAENKDLLPRHLRFVRGVVESDDLPLNVSRETLQENPLVFKIRETLTRKLLDRFLDLAEKSPEDYGKFWTAFGPVLKEGHSDFPNREKFLELLRFNASRHDDAEGLVGLAAYVDDMPSGQDAIYYLSGASRDALQQDPRLELFRKKGVEVLYLYDLADEFCLGGIGTYKEKNLVSADQVKPEDLKGIGTNEGDDASKDSDKKEEASNAALDPLIDRFKEVLGDRVVDVRRSERLVDSPACLVGDDGQSSAHVEKIMRMMQKSSEAPRRVLEIHPQHALILDLARLVEKDPKDPLVERACEQLFEGSLLVDGYLADPHKLVERMSVVLGEAAKLKVAQGEAK